jgi:N-acylneuraminate cytidylyltransferase
MYNTVCLIPARGGSKGIPHKNIKLLNGKPLIAYTIECALKVQQIKETFVSTDDKEIANIAREFGAKVPFLRPSELAKDNSPASDFIYHFLTWYTTTYGSIMEFLVLLLPPTPIRDPALVSEAIMKIHFNPKCTGLRSVDEFPESPYKWMKLGKDGYLHPLLNDDYEMHYTPRQEVPNVYRPNGYVDIIKIATLIFYKDTLFGNRMIPFITPHSVDIDNIDDFNYAEFLIKKEKK